MTSLYLLIFLMVCVGLAGWLIFLWAVKSGQFDDVERPKYRMLDDDDNADDADDKKQPPKGAK